MRTGGRGNSSRVISPSFSHQMEVVMSRVITFDKGSKRQLNLIRWKLREVISLFVLSLFVLGLCVLLALWEVSRYSEEPKTPHVQARP